MSQIIMTRIVYIQEATSKTVFIKYFADRQIELKITFKMLSQIGLIHHFHSPNFHKTGDSSSTGLL